MFPLTGGAADESSITIPARGVVVTRTAGRA